VGREEDLVPHLSEKALHLVQTSLGQTPDRKDPEAVLTKYDHVYKYAGFREEPPDPEAEAAPGSRALAQRPDHRLREQIAISECIVCGEKKEAVYGWR